MPRDRITQLHQSYGFVEFMGEEDADYAIKIMNMIKLYGKPIRVNKVKLVHLYVGMHTPYLHSIVLIPRPPHPAFVAIITSHFSYCKQQKLGVESSERG